MVGTHLSDVFLLILTGRIENKSNRRVDKVSAILIQRIRYESVADPMIHYHIESCNVHEESLALFIDAEESIKIDRNFAIPPLAPTTFIEGESTTTRANSNTYRNPLSTIASVVVIGRIRNSIIANDNVSLMKRRIIHITYRLIIRVKIRDTSSFDIEIPVIIGTRPYKINEKQIEQRQSNSTTDEVTYECHYRQQRHDRPITLSSVQQHKHQHINKYPFYTNLPTSSKQSKTIIR